MITLFTAFILFVLATAGVKGFAFMLGHRHDRLAVHGGAVHAGGAGLARAASAILRSPRALGAARAARALALRLQRREPLVLLDLGTILAIGAISLATKQLNLGIDFTSGSQDQGEPAEARERRRGPQRAPRRPGIGNASSAEIQSVTNAKFGPNVIEIQGKILNPAGERPRQERARQELRPARRRTGLPQHSPSARPSAPRCAKCA